MKDIVSVIVPVHNSEAYIEHCIDSLIRQSYPYIEILLIENGSIDHSYRICQEYTKKDERVRAYHLDESGVSRARNYGMQKARGRYIVFADSDDYCEEDWCLRLIEAERLGEHAYLPVCGYRKVNGYRKEVLQEYCYENQEVSKVELENILDIHDRSLLNTPCNKLYRKSVIIDYCIEMPEDMSLGEDLVFNLRYLEAYGGQGFIIQNQVLYNYVRDGKESLDHCYRDDYHYVVQRMYDALHEFCTKREIMLSGIFWNWAMWMYQEVLQNTYSQSSKQNVWQRYRFNNHVMKDQRLGETVKHIGKNNGMPAYVGYSSKNYAILLLMQQYENFKRALRKR